MSRAWAWGVVGVVAALAGYAVAKDPPGVVQASEFQLIDDSGRVRAILGMRGGEPRLVYLDAQGSAKPEQPADVSPVREQASDFKPKGVLASSLEAEHDDVRDRYSVSTPELQLREGVKVQAHLAGRGTVVASPQIVSIGFIRVADDWQWLRFSDVAAMLGERRFAPRHNLSTDTLSSGGVYESMFVFVTIDEAVEIAGGKSFRVSIGTSDFTLPPEFAARMKTLLDSIGATVPK